MSHYGGRRSADYAAPDASSQHSPPSSSGAATPTSTSGASSSFLSNSFYNAFGGIIRRLSSDPAGQLQPSPPSAAASTSHHSHLNITGSSDSSGFFDGGGGSSSNSNSNGRSLGHPATFPAPAPHHGFLHAPANGVDGVFMPALPVARTASPMRPPPLEPLTLKGFHADTPPSARLLSAPIAEEIRIMVPERLRIEDEWKLAYSLDQDGASLATLYEKTAAYAEHRSGFVLVVKDQEGGVFGAYLTEYPHPSPHYFGTGECFLWRASVLASLPPPPSADTANLATRSTTISASPAEPTSGAATASSVNTVAADPEPLISGLSGITQPTHPAIPQPPTQPQSPPQPPPSPSIRFSAFPYSGVNEYFMYCEAHSLSVGGGDGKYGLWLDDSLEKGISATCLTFGNQPLSDEGDKFGVLGVEVWVIGSRR